jgi:hypothetical protein
MLYLRKRGDLLMSDSKYFMNVLFAFMVLIGFSMALSELSSSYSDSVTIQAFVGSTIGFLGFQGLLLQYYLSQKNK